MRRKNYKLDAERRCLYLEHLRQGHNLTEAARAVGLSRQTVWEYVRRHPEFQTQIDDAEMEACDAVETVLYNRALAGDSRCMMFWLRCRNPQRWNASPPPQPQPQPKQETADGASLDEMRQRLVDAVAAARRSGQESVSLA